jgi:RNA polymerase sigma factor (sigma-70 family)
MAGIAPATVHREMTSLFDSGSLTGLNDRELIESFMLRGDATAAAALELLVARHGPMVERVCRNVLSRREDVEDAFQATFLVLVKQCASIRKLDSVASWLFGVAMRVAARARVEGARRTKSERHPLRLATETIVTGEQAEERELAAFGPIVQEEVRRLPEKYRAVVLLCYWEGLTQEQAAHQLGCPIGTVRSRVARARELLRQRLMRRGLAPALAFAETSDLQAAVPLASVESNLVCTTVRSATRVLGGQSAAEVVSANIAATVQSITWSMMMTRVRAAVPALVLLGLTALGGQLLAQRTGEREAAEKPGGAHNREVTASKTAKVSGGDGLQEYIVEPPDLVLVEVLEALPGRPISGERLVRPDGRISLGFYGEVYVAGLTPREIKEKVVLHLSKYLNDESLGLETHDVESKRITKVKPADSDRVFVDVTAYSSKFFYVQGEFNEPGRFPLTGRETVLDAINLAGGLTPAADHTYLSLLRPNPSGGLNFNITIQPDSVTQGADPAANRTLQPGDRLVAFRDKGVRGNLAEEEEKSSLRHSEPQSRPWPWYDRPPDSGSSRRQHAGGIQDENPNRSRGPDSAALRSLERRIVILEQKLDRVIGLLAATNRGSGKSEPPSERGSGSQ